ncbi:hypothetical protein GOBAR_AA37972 [Gossypium barbadense]|uniref:Uncharacterized protein n=1 Tax=Gossypium barbadense TaxID=3634 RepID=A0A2P5VV76_GOSBA|nr:hypothetical protein GOBAR_AA37972 [Gossypium barbadense]
MESNGLGSKGLNPDANLEVLKKPSEPHFNRSPGIASVSGFLTRCCEENAEKQRIESQEEEEDGVSFRMIVLSDEETFAVTVILDANRCIVSSFQVRSLLSSNSIRWVILSNSLCAMLSSTVPGKNREMRAENKMQRWGNVWIEIGV